LSKNKYWRTNEYIRSPKVRVIGSSGKQLGILDINKALALAKKEGLDLVEIAPNAKPPVTRIVEFGKFKYEEEKKQKAQKKKTKTSELKEMRFSPFIGDADYQTRLVRIREFLGEKNKVKVVVKFKGRQMGSKQYGYKVLDRLLGDLGERINIDMEPKFLGRHLVMVISPVSGEKKSKKPEKKTQAKKPKKENKDAKAKN
jgi:translation initiation factor IF-3